MTTPQYDVRNHLHVSRQAPSIIIFQFITVASINQLKSITYPLCPVSRKRSSTSKYDESAIGILLSVLYWLVTPPVHSQATQPTSSQSKERWRYRALKTEEGMRPPVPPASSNRRCRSNVVLRCEASSNTRPSRPSNRTTPTLPRSTHRMPFASRTNAWTCYD